MIEDVFPIENGDYPKMSLVSELRGVTGMILQVLQTVVFFPYSHVCVIFYPKNQFAFGSRSHGKWQLLEDPKHDRVKHLFFEDPNNDS